MDIKEVIGHAFVSLPPEGLKTKFDPQSVDVKDMRTMLILPGEKTSRSLNSVKTFRKIKRRVSFIPNSTAPTAGLSTKPREGSRTDPTLSSVSTAQEKCLHSFSH